MGERDRTAATSPGADCGQGAEPVPVGQLVTRLGPTWSHGLRHALGPVDLEPRQFALLRTIASMAGGSQQAVGSALRIPPSRMVDLVDGLEARGLVSRVANPGDRRAHALVLTGAGIRLLAEAVGLADAWERALLAPLDPDERTQLHALLTRLDTADPR